MATPGIWLVRVFFHSVCFFVPKEAKFHHTGVGEAGVLGGPSFPVIPVSHSMGATTVTKTPVGSPICAQSVVDATGQQSVKHTILVPDSMLPSEGAGEAEGREGVATVSLPTPVKIRALLRELRGYNPRDVQFLQEGFTMGFRLQFEGERGTRLSPNLKSAMEHPEIVRDKLRKELSLNRIAGPFDVPLLKILFPHPLELSLRKFPVSFGSFTIYLILLAPPSMMASPMN